MMNRSYKNVVLLSLVTFALWSCSKDDNADSPGSSTNGKSTAIFNSNLSYGTLTDQEGNVYKTITIGTQTWMAENLRTTKYNDGADIPNLNGSWIGLTRGAYRNYKSSSNNDTIATFGRIYNWYTIGTGKIAPEGWHVPTDEEWSTLITYLNGIFDAGLFIKETGTSHWGSLNFASNESGFTALPGGYYGTDNQCHDIGNMGGWWSSTEYGGSGAWYRYIYSSSNEVFRISTPKTLGLSIRCIKD